MNESVFVVDGMKCAGCATTVQNKLTTIAGISQVDISLPEKQVRVTSTAPVGAKEIQEALKGTPYVLRSVVN